MCTCSLGGWFASIASLLYFRISYSVQMVEIKTKASFNTFLYYFVLQTLLYLQLDYCLSICTQALSVFAIDVMWVVRAITGPPLADNTIQGATTDSIADFFLIFY